MKFTSPGFSIVTVLNSTAPRNRIHLSSEMGVPEDKKGWYSGGEH